MSLPEPSKEDGHAPIQEAVKPFVDADDFTNVHITAQKMIHQIEQEEDPYLGGGNARQHMARMARNRRM